MYELVKHLRANASAERWSASTPPTVEAHPQQPVSLRPAYVQARVNGRVSLCLLDSGADVSLIPSRYVDSSRLTAPESNRLFAANETEISVDGQVTVTVVIQQRRYPSTFFASENVDEVILGRDWLANNSYLEL